ncbi:MAG TPA: LysE family translocator [Acidocella sp.]|nr:LysE family translocator [Acidocella sp.]
MHLLLPLLTFSAAATLLTITPGTDTMMVLRTAAARGQRSGAAAALGIGLGCMFWGAGAAFGLTALLTASKLAFTVLKTLGAAYLLWLGLNLLRHPRHSLSPPAGQQARGLWPAFRGGLLTNLLNPKIGIFYITFLPQFIPHGANVPAFCLLLAGIHVLLSLLWYSLLIALTRPLGAFLSRPRTVKALDRITGCVFTGFGLNLALAHPP